MYRRIFYVEPAETMIVEVIISLILLGLSIASFVPQLQRLRNKRSASDLSIWSLLINLLIATESVALISLGVIVGIVDDEPDNECNYMIHHPRDIRDWLNVAQFVVIWLGHFVLLCLALALPPKHTSKKLLIVILYLAFLTISIGPIILLASLFPEDDKWGRMFIMVFSFTIVEPLLQLCGLIGLFLQWRTTISQHSSENLNLRGLVAHAVSFSLVGFSLFFRLRFPAEYWQQERFAVAIQAWYYNLGWAPVNNLIFAATQGILAFVVWKQRKSIVLTEHEILLDDDDAREGQP